MVAFAADPDERLTDDLLTHSEGPYALYNDYLEQIRQGKMKRIFNCEFISCQRC